MAAQGDSAAAGESLIIDTQGSQEGAEDLIVRLRGLPYSATRLDILELLKDCEVVNKENGVTFTFTEEGRPSGEAFVDLASEDDVAKALEHNNEHMGRRYVEIFRATKGEKEWDLRVSSENKAGAGGSRDGGENVVRLRGLPFGVTDEQVINFFSGLSIVPGGIVVQRDDDGRETGIGFVEFTNKEEAERALEKDRKSMGHRYIEVFRSTVSEIKPIKSSRPTPYERPRGNTRHYGGYGGYGDGSYRNERSFTGGRRGGHGRYHHQDDYYSNYKNEPFYEDSSYSGYNNKGSFQPSYPPQPPNRGGDMISYPTMRSGQHPPPQADPSGGFDIRMRGLPYSATENDIQNFFAPQVPVKIHLDRDTYDRPSGDGIVTFRSRHDAELAMGKNKNNIGHRYIELFPQYNVDSRPPPAHQPPPQQQSWNDPRAQQGPPPPIASGPPGYHDQYHHQPPHQQRGGYGDGPQYQQQSGGYNQPSTNWAGVGY